MIKEELFKIKGVGIDTSTITERPVSGILGDPGYIFTSIPANNDYLIDDYIKSINVNTPLVVYTDFIDHLDEALFGHLKTIGRNAVDLLLISPKIDWTIGKDMIKELKDVKRIKNFGVSNPESIEEIKSIEEKTGEKIKYISLNISPLEFNYDIIKWSEENEISIFGFNPFGGYISAARSIDAFTTPYLLGFIATWSDVVFLSGRDLYKSWKSNNYLKSLIGKETSPKYVIKKNVSRLIKPLKKLIGTSVVVNENITIPYEDSEVILETDNLELSLGGVAISKIPPLEEEKDDKVCKEITEYLKMIFFPKDATKKDIFAIARYKVTQYLEVTYPKKDGWTYNYVGLGDSVLAILISKPRHIKGKWFWKKVVEEETNRFLLLMPEGKNNMIFLREKDENIVSNS